MEALQTAWLRSDGVSFAPAYRVTSDERLYRRLKSKFKSGPYKGRSRWKRVRLHPTDDGRFRWNVKHPQTGERIWVTAHRATLESFTTEGQCLKGLVAAHAPGTKPSDGALGTCSWKTQQGNRADRVLTGTHSTGPNTGPGKLTARNVERLIAGWDNEPNVSLWARRFGCARSNINYHRRRHGKL
jgi:hypothetical protein